MLLAADAPSIEVIIFLVTVLIGAVGWIVEQTREVRKRSIEQQRRREEHPFADEPRAERPAPPPRPQPLPLPASLPGRVVPPPPRRRVLPRPAPPPAAVPAPPPRAVRPPAPLPPPAPREVQPVLRLLRGDASSLRTAVVLAEVLGKPRALRPYRPRG